MWDEKPYPWTIFTYWNISETTLLITTGHGTPSLGLQAAYKAFTGYVTNCRRRGYVTKLGSNLKCVCALLAFPKKFKRVQPAENEDYIRFTYIEIHYIHTYIHTYKFKGTTCTTGVPLPFCPTYLLHTRRSFVMPIGKDKIRPDWPIDITTEEQFRVRSQKAWNLRQRSSWSWGKQSVSCLYAALFEI